MFYGRTIRRRRFRRRGTAVTEFVLVLPFLAIILALTFFFGWAMMHKQQVLVADRYSAWQRVETGVWPSEDRLNQVIFDSRALEVDLSSETPVQETVEDLIAEAGRISRRTQVLAEDLISQQYPPGRRAHVSASFTTQQPIWQKTMQGGEDIHHRHGREGVTWRRSEVSCWSVLRDLYYSEFDAAVERVPTRSRQMAQMIRTLYLRSW